MVELIKSYTDIQLSVTPDLTEDQIKDLNKLLANNQASLIDYRKLPEFNFEFSIRSYFDPNSTYEIEKLSRTLKDHFEQKQYKVCFVDITE